MDKTPLISAALLTLISSVSMADTMQLNNGKTLEGSFVGKQGDVITFNVDGIELSIQAKEVKGLSIASTAAAPKATATPAPATNEGHFELASGTALKIKLQQTLDSGKHASGHKFTATLEGNLLDGNATVAAAGSKVYGVITEAKKAGRIAGKAKMVITITDINIDGKIVPVKTSVINANTASSGKSTASKMIRGAAIGGLANGSDGAKDGAKIGAGIAILSKGTQVVIPSGSLLDFKLAAALKV
ncbi:MAG: hypothetical protein HRU20_00505 [Pseudomonadales bacterium]|nr:hypothetical protein [Pseudomonadales bacterium]